MSRRLHLLEVGVRWPPETFLRRKLEGLVAAGVRVTVASSLPPGAPRPPIEGVELLAGPHWADPRARKLARVAIGLLGLLLRSPRRAVALLRATTGPLAPGPGRGFWQTLGHLYLYLPLARLRPDLVQYEWETAAIYYLPLTEVWGCPVLMACRGANITAFPEARDEGRAARLRAAFARSAAVHCVSESTLEEARRHGLDRGKARVIRAGVDTEFFRPAGSANGARPELRILAVGNLRWFKGYEYALGAVAELNRRGIPARLDVLGGDPAPEVEERGERDRIAYTAADLGLDGEVRMRDGVPREEVRRRLRAADVLLHASLAEGIPNAVLEAMSCELPVVACDSGGVREAVTDGVEGFVAAPRDPGALADALARLGRDPELRRRMGRAGRARVRASFSPQREREGFARLYAEVAA